MGKEFNSFEEIMATAFACDKCENKNLLFLETIKDAIKAARGEEIPAESRQRFEVLFPCLDVAIENVKEHQEEQQQMRNIKDQLDQLVESFGHGGHAFLFGALDILFRSYLSSDDSNDSEMRSSMYDFIMGLKMIFECHQKIDQTK